MLRGYDLVTLVVVEPALAVGLSGARRGSVRALVWLGMPAATVCTHACYVFLPARPELGGLDVLVNNVGGVVQPTYPRR